MTRTLAIVLFSVGLLGSIMLHEWGHFWTARRFGMRADRFFVGFGPTLFSRRRGETEYGVKAFPIGGFVRIIGMSPTDERKPPIADDVFDAEAVGALRHAAAEQAGIDVALAPAIPAALWVRLADELDARGTSPELRDRIVEGTRGSLAPDATVDEAHVALRQVLAQEVRETRRVGDLHHRLLKGDEGRFFHDRPSWQRAIVLSAGSAMHFAQAFGLIFLLLWLSGPVTTFNRVGQVVEDTPAATAGLQPGDDIVAIDGEHLTDFEETRQIIRSSAGKPLIFSIVRDGESLEATATPELARDPSTGEVLLDDEGEPYGLLGFQAFEATQPLPFGEAVVRTFSGPGSVPDITVGTISVLGQVFGPEGIGSIFNQVSGEEVRDEGGALSIVGAAGIAGDFSEAIGLWVTIATLLGSINIFIGVFNILPLPPLDGGHLAVLGVEKVVNVLRRARGRAADFTVDPRAVTAVALPVIVFVGLISVSLLWLDIVNPLNLVP